jgi:hypothetical protein
MRVKSMSEATARRRSLGRGGSVFSVRRNPPAKAETQR